MNITVLLSAYNGEKYIGAQIDSLLAQQLPDGCTMNILVRDDGSTDGTRDILDEYKSRGELDWYTGENLRPAKSFWHLIGSAPESDYYAFCDQDDVWNADKLARAIGAIERESEPAVPTLYCSNVAVADSELNYIREFNGSGYEAHTDFPHALIYSLAPGCTMVFNAAARAELVKYDMEREFVIIHDWLAHKIIAMLGKVIYDSEPSMLYRQHGGNVIGADSDGRIKKFFKKVKRVLGENACVRSDNAKSLLNVYGDAVSGENEHVLRMVADYRKDKKLKKEFLKSKLFDTAGFDYLRWLIRLNKV